MRSKIWVGVGMVVVAGTAASAQPFAADAAGKVRAQPGWQVAAADTAKALPASQGGEGGEAGAAATGEITDAGLSEKLAELSAHLWLAQTLNSNSGGAEAAEVLTHALESIYPQVAPGLANRQIAPLEAALKSVLEAARKSVNGAKFDSVDLERQLMAADAVITPKGAALARHEAGVIVGLAKSASIEFGEAVVDGQIKAIAEYRLASAFVRAAIGRFKGVEAQLKDKSAVATADIADGLSALGASLNSLDALPAVRLTPAQFSAIASRLELKASRFTN